MVCDLFLLAHLLVPPICLIIYWVFHDKVALKHLMETVVPVLTALKHVLEKAHSPLLRELMFYLGELFRYGTETIVSHLGSMICVICVICMICMICICQAEQICSRSCMI